MYFLVAVEGVIFQLSRYFQKFPIALLVQNKKLHHPIDVGQDSVQSHTGEMYGVTPPLHQFYSKLDNQWGESTKGSFNFKGYCLHPAIRQ